MFLLQFKTALMYTVVEGQVERYFFDLGTPGLWCVH